MSRAWFKFYGRDFRDGVRDLPWDVVGIYTVLLTLMYEQEGGRIKDHDQRLCRLVGCDVRMWRRAREMLLTRSKLHLTEDGYLTNDRVEIEQRSAEHLSEVRAISGRSSRQLTDSKKAKSRKTNGSAEANAEILPLYARAVPESEPEKPIDKSIGLARERAPKPKRISTNQTLPTEPTEAMVTQAASRGIVNGSLAAEFDKWRDYHLANGTTIADVEASFRTWIGKAIEYRRRASQPRATPSARPAIYPNPYRG